MSSSSEHHSDESHNWLVFFFVCFGLIMAIGAWAIFCYDCNAPEKQPGGGGHGMIVPQDGQEYAAGAIVWPKV